MSAGLFCAHNPTSDICQPNINLSETCPLPLAKAARGLFFRVKDIQGMRNMEKKAEDIDRLLQPLPENEEKELDQYLDKHDIE